MSVGAAERRAADGRWPGRTLLLALLGTPTIWIIAFMVAYLAAEWLCIVEGAQRGHDRSTLLIAVVIGATLVALVASAALTWRVVAIAGRGPTAAGDDSEASDIRLMAILLVSWFVPAVLVIGLPALVLGPC